MRPLRVLAVASAVGMVAFLTPAAQATHSWGGYHWARTSNPFTIKLGNNVSSGWSASLRGASTDWSQSTVLDTAVVAGGTRAKPCKATAGQDQVCSASYGNTGWLGVASIWLSGKHITQGTVKLNDYYFGPGSTYDTPAWRNMVTCQEIGHTLGLDHQDENFDNTNLGTCMDYTSNPLGPPDNEHPNKHDYDELGTIYRHLDSTTTVAASLPASSAQVGDDPGSWGRRVEGSRTAGFSTYVRDVGNGGRVVTFVTWAR